jgi:hypothetical protein
MTVKKHAIVLDQATMARVTELCRLGARPPVIYALFPDFPKDLVVDMWVIHQGKRPPKGPLPSDLNSYMLGSHRRLQSSFILKTFSDLRNAGSHDVDAIIAAHRLYLETFKDHAELNPLFSVERTWVLIREFISVRSIALVRCPCCHAQYVHKAYEFVNHRLCPMYKLIPHTDDILQKAINPSWTEDAPADRKGRQANYSMNEIAMPTGNSSVVNPFTYADAFA